MRFTTIEIKIINDLVGCINVTKLCVWFIYKSSLDFLLCFVYYLCLWLYFFGIWFYLSIPFIICVRNEVYLNKKGIYLKININWDKLFRQRNVSIFRQTCTCISQQFSLISIEVYQHWNESYQRFSRIHQCYQLMCMVHL